MEIIIVICLVLMLVLQSGIAAALWMDKDRRTFKECREDQRIERKRRAAHRERSEDQLRQDAFMREVETYNGEKR